MSSEIIGLIGIGSLFLLLSLRIPISIALFLVGFFGISAIIGFPGAVSTLTTESFLVASDAGFIIIPLFVLMGNFATASGLSRDLFNAANAWLGWMKGGLAVAGIAACAGFAALSGSSIASAATMGSVALPEMKRFNYDPKLATGCIAAGGTLGILIPPSTGLVVYAILTENSIGALFLAGILPGLLLATLFMVTIVIMTAINPKLGPAGEKFSMRERLGALVAAVPLLTIVTATIGGIYSGIFTVSEAAGVGAFMVFIYTLVRKKLSLSILSSILLETINTTGFVFLIIMGAFVFSPFLALSGIPQSLAIEVASLDTSPVVILGLVLLGCIILGMFLDGFAILILTLPIIYPIVIALGYNPIWFGVIMVVVLEMGLISPPVGMNVFIVKGVAGDVPMSDIFRGVLPFWLAMFICLALLVSFPQISLFLPQTMAR